MSREAIAHIGLGSNLGNPEAQVLAAFDEIAATPGIELERRSSLYRTAPIGYDNQPDFINAVARVRTTLAPQALLDQLLSIERMHGRIREVLNAPRTLDLDLLMFGTEIINEPGLQLPHPRLHERAFVLVPLAEIAPALEIPGHGRVRELLAPMDVSAIEPIS